MFDLKDKIHVYVHLNSRFAQTATPYGQKASRY